MNCEMFEAVVDDLAREQPLDAATRLKALAHAETCAYCAARLADGRSLNAALRALAASDESKQASPGLESALKAAFRQRKKAKIIARNKRVWAVGAAAAAITLVTFALYFGRRVVPRGERSERAAATPVASADNKPWSKTQTAPHATTVFRAARKARRRNDRLRKAVGDSPAKERAWATDFLLLPYADNSEPLTSGEVVRIRLPRSAFASFGLPVGEEGDTGAVVADVLIGDDGVARAISFVQ